MSCLIRGASAAASASAAGSLDSDATGLVVVAEATPVEPYGSMSRSIGERLTNPDLVTRRYCLTAAADAAISSYPPGGRPSGRPDRGRSTG
jgi:hypothetical protein